MSLVDIPEPLPDLARVRVFIAVMCLGLLALVLRLWYLQIAHGDEMWAASEVNRSRLIRRVPPRGQIEERTGRVVATNRRKIVVSVVPDEIRKHPEILPTLASLLGGVTAEELESRVEANRTTAFDPVRVAVDIDIHTATSIEEQKLDLPGVTVGPEPIRFYPDGALYGHVLGQMGQIAPEELKARRDEGYQPGDFCGRLGLERAYDAMLRGKDGGREVEVDARGRIRRVVGNNEPIPGDTLRLAIDGKTQKVAWDALSIWAARGKPGAAVALDPHNGAVLSLVSVPSYDPNQFVTGISGDDWKKLQQDPLKPQLDRAISGGTAPGSTFKVVTASAGLELGLINPSDRVFCSGSMRLGSWTKHCHKAAGHGSVDLEEAIAESCDVYFYHLGQRIGPDRLAEFARRFGLGARTGLDITRGDKQIETDGLVPDRKWKKAVRHEEWMGGETVDYAIGQAMLKCTPLQMCNIAAAIANGGTLYRPQFVQRVTQYDEANRAHVVKRLQPEAIGHLDISPRTMRQLVSGMRAVMQPGGTGAHSAIAGLPMAGKTGTAEVRMHGRKVTSAWYIGYAPADDPKIAVCVYVQEGGHGGEAAAPIARKMIAAYLHIPIEEAGAAPALD